MYTYKNGDKYEGNYHDGEKFGPGSFIQTNGSKFEATYFEGLLHGKVTKYNTEGRVTT